MAANATDTYMMNNIHLGNVSRRLAAGPRVSKRRIEEAAQQNTPRSRSRCCPRRSSPGHCLQYSAGQSPDDCTPYGMQRSSPSSDCPQLYLAREKTSDVSCQMIIYEGKCFLHNHLSRLFDLDIQLGHEIGRNSITTYYHSY